jgi:hypothetical protein
VGLLNLLVLSFTTIKTSSDGQAIFGNVASLTVPSKSFASVIFSTDLEFIRVLSSFDSKHLCESIDHEVRLFDRKAKITVLANNDCGVVCSIDVLQSCCVVELFFSLKNDTLSAVDRVVVIHAFLCDVRVRHQNSDGNVSRKLVFVEAARVVDQVF